MTSKGRTPRRASNVLLLALFCLCLFAVVFCIKHWHNDKHPASSANAQRQGELRRPTQPTLVIYILSFSDAAYIENFYFFFLEAIARDATAKFEILLPKGHGRDSAILPDLPSHARYIEHDRNCRGLSLVRWYLATRPDDGSLERYVLVSSAVRGPFIPPGLRDLVSWHSALGLGLDSGAGLAGGVVSCAQPPERWGLEGSEPPLHPFLEFTALAASRAAVEELLRLPPEQLGECPPATGAAVSADTDAVHDTDAGTGNLDSAAGGLVDAAAVVAAEGLTAAEAEAMVALRAWSGAVLAAGMGLASLAVRQQGADWTDRRTWSCNGGLSPLVERANDGLSLLPYEAMFLPVSEYDDGDMPYGAAAEYATTYTEWMRVSQHEPAVTAAAALPKRRSSGGSNSSGIAPAGEGTDRRHGPPPPPPPPPIHGTLAADPSHPDPDPAPDPARELAARNRYLGLSSEYKLPGVLVAVAQGEGCFDAEHFLQANPDVVGLTPREAWKFYVFYAQFQPRPFRLKCGVDWSKFGLRGSGGRRRRGRQQQRPAAAAAAAAAAGRQAGGRLQQDPR
ncbi:hypothetical protein PLESTB_001364200 [Pleodorina starrii]|uniref:Hexosyltransferase n=1 Tax=Pleodorina starrii TaxID=330485 RepID=A0A9W6BV07_9CHLO|nr:hypothetical protein PLESTM_000420800 [Pleodorina starrii]GLC58465.1 hypothetical protein PLESTB_001364200 [Pleodorina starrii]